MVYMQRARVALGGSSLPDPQALVSPPTTGQVPLWIADVVVAQKNHRKDSLKGE
jgi:hypothetical protein